MMEEQGPVLSYRLEGSRMIFGDHTTKLYEPVGHQIASNVLLIMYMKKHRTESKD